MLLGILWCKGGAGGAEAGAEGAQDAFVTDDDILRDMLVWFGMLHALPMDWVENRSFG